eukprot:scaffold31086_cov27-Tisochrysis_lutea.AAC.5
MRHAAGLDRGGADRRCRRRTRAKRRCRASAYDADHRVGAHRARAAARVVCWQAKVVTGTVEVLHPAPRRRGALASCGERWPAPPPSRPRPRSGEGGGASALA